MKRKLSLLMIMMLTIATIAVSLPQHQNVRSNMDSVDSISATALSEEELNADILSDRINNQIQDRLDIVMASLEENIIEYENAVEVNKIDEIYYAAADVVNVREEPDIESGIITKLLKNDEVHVVGEVTEEGIEDWVQIEINNEPAYVVAKYLSKEQQERIRYGKEEWAGQKLNAYAGRITGPNGDETFYNLDMSGIVDMMHRRGVEGEYWVREDGVKMLGDYIMVAANLKKFPRGTLVETSLGIGIVCDTGGFVYNGSGVTFDLATTWDS